MQTESVDQLIRKSRCPDRADSPEPLADKAWSQMESDGELIRKYAKPYQFDTLCFTVTTP
jgi:hypothetical protein